MESVPAAQPFEVKVSSEGKKESEVPSFKLKISETGQDVAMSTPTPQVESKRIADVTPDSVEKVEKTSLSLQAREAEEQALVAAAKQKEVEMHHAELLSLKKQAEELEQQSKALLEEAEAEREKVRKALDAAQKAEEMEGQVYQTAEAIETKRREAAQVAMPALESAEAAELYAQEVTSQAEDHEFHASILENRAKALISESGQLAELAKEKQAQADAVAEKIAEAERELEELEQKADDGKPGDLPDYIVQCEREMGILQRRLAQLAEEIQWSRREVERRRKDGELWDRLLTKRRASLAELKTELSDIQMLIEDSMARSHVAVEEAKMPAEMAEAKFAIAARLRGQATEAANKAIKIQREAIEAARKAMDVQKEREMAMLEASKAEAAGRRAKVEAEEHEKQVSERETMAQKKREEASALKQRAEETMAKKEGVDKIHSLSQLHPMYYAGSDLIETAPPAPKTPSTSIMTAEK